MARMYSRRRGKSGSKRPAQRIASWVKFKPAEIEQIVVKLAKKDNDSAKIGLMLRDEYGIPTVKVKSLKIARILKKHNLYPEYPEDMLNLMRKAVSLHNHLAGNKKDGISKRGLELTESKIRRLAKYYKSRGILPKDWNYDIEQARLIVK
jgi:small subunit ribosomal protein S15